MNISRICGDKLRTLLTGDGFGFVPTLLRPFDDGGWDFGQELAVTWHVVDDVQAVVCDRAEPQRRRHAGTVAHCSGGIVKDQPEGVAVTGAHDRHPVPDRGG